MIIAIMCLLLLITGCTSFDKALESLNDRQLRGCYKIHIQGGGMMSSVHGSADGFIVTGGASIDECRAAFSGVTIIEGL